MMVHGGLVVPFCVLLNMFTIFRNEKFKEKKPHIMKSLSMFSNSVSQEYIQGSTDVCLKFQFLIYS